MSDLQSLSGVGPGKESKLRDAGIESVNELANADLDTLENAGIRQAETILDRAQRQGVQIQSGVAVEEEQQEAAKVTTSLPEVDAMMGGGLRGGFIVGVSGESKAGKTQFALQSLVAAAQYHVGEAVYIETEPNRFQTERLRSLIRDDGEMGENIRKGVNGEDGLDGLDDQDDRDDRHEEYLDDPRTDPRDVLSHIHKIEAYEPDDDVDNLRVQRNSYDAVRETFDEVSIVVVDSFIANFRLSGEFTDRSDLPDRNAVIADHLEAIQSLSNDFDCPVLLTLQVQGDPDAYSGSDFSLWGPVLMDHTITHLLHLTHGKGDKKQVELKGHPSQPDDEVTLHIPEDEPLISA
ncbi:hypothetical protein Z052_01950 [Halorubrum sp. C191]|uniref:helix-hairpin-helix domain-containing protein n=1 Tax=Halorubrum sp. C191 TaxID=1383842 RepID=UPI000C07AA7D|nr:helix-hairpin-helix domain-containing protein [Halorubrum sp. C191]PHQ43926.1 hypothetical protein Z052_01950 [Halorubrum sp. C191]